MSNNVPGAAGGVVGVGGSIVEMLRQRDLPVRALVHRQDEREDTLRATGAEVIVGDLPTRRGHAGLDGLLPPLFRLCRK